MRRYDDVPYIWVTDLEVVGKTRYSSGTRVFGVYRLGGLPSTNLVLGHSHSGYGWGVTGVAGRVNEWGVYSCLPGLTVT